MRAATSQVTPPKQNLTMPNGSRLQTQRTGELPTGAEIGGELPGG
jgi:hypothetical protein